METKQARWSRQAYYTQLISVLVLLNFSLHKWDGNKASAMESAGLSHTCWILTQLEHSIRNFLCLVNTILDHSIRNFLSQVQYYSQLISVLLLLKFLRYWASRAGGKTSTMAAAGGGTAPARQGQRRKSSAGLAPNSNWRWRQAKTQM